MSSSSSSSLSGGGGLKRTGSRGHLYHHTPHLPQSLSSLCLDALGGDGEDVGESELAQRIGSVAREVRKTQQQLLELQSELLGFKERRNNVIVRTLRQFSVFTNAALGAYLFSWRLISYLKNNSRFLLFLRFVLRKRWKRDITESGFVRSLWRTVLHVAFPAVAFFFSAYMLAQRQSWFRTLGGLSSIVSSSVLLYYSTIFPLSTYTNLLASALYMALRVHETLSQVSIITGL